MRQVERLRDERVRVARAVGRVDAAGMCAESVRRTRWTGIPEIRGGRDWRDRRDRPEGWDRWEGWGVRVSGEPLRAILATPGVDLRPAPGDRVCAISWAVDALLEPAPDTPVPAGADLLARRAEVLPALRTGALAGVRVGVRPVPADGLPPVGPHAEAEGLYTVVTHSGVTLAPLLGVLAAREITEGTPLEELAPYRLDRDTSHPVRDESLAVMSGYRAEPEPDAEPGTESGTESGSVDPGA